MKEILDQNRSLSVRTLLTELKLEPETLHCSETTLILQVKPDQSLKSLAEGLKASLDKATEIQSVDFWELAAKGIENSSSVEIDKRGALSLLAILKNQQGMTARLEQKEECLHIGPLPPAFVAFFQNIENVQIEELNQEKYLSFSLPLLLKNYPSTLLLIEGESPCLLLEYALLAEKKVFYIEEKISETQIRIKPYFCIPLDAQTPHYEFFLDTSSSMRIKNNIESLKKSVIALAEQLFSLYPKTSITLWNFDDKINLLGEFKSLASLEAKVGELTTGSQTCLYQTTEKILRAFEKNRYADPKHKNILLFTDGENTVDKDLEGAYIHCMKEILTFNKNTNPLIFNKNKFFIISYNQKQPEILEQITAAFDSRVIQTDELDLINAFAKEGKLETWPRARDLFTCRFNVKHGSTSSFFEYSKAYDFSGQFTALTPFVCEKGSSFNLLISDSSNTLLLDDTYQSSTPTLSEKPQNEAILSSPRNHGIFSSPSKLPQSPKSDAKDPQDESNFVLN